MLEEEDSEVIARARQKERELLEVYEKMKIKSDMSVAVPTSDSEVRKRLRSLGLPICLFGEDAFARRERLKLVSSVSSSNLEIVKTINVVDEKKRECFFTEGSAGLLSARKAIARDSLEKCRIPPATNDAQSNFWDSPNVMASSQIGDSRPLTSIVLCPFDSLVAVSGWSGDVNIFETNSMAQRASLRAHNDRCVSVVWGRRKSDRVALASCGVDTTIRLWTLPQDAADTVLGPLDTLEGHELRVNRIAFHPHLPQFLASTSDDETWRLWDIERREELLLQEGHIAPVFGLCFHPHGSLLATSDTAAVIRVWDLRTGRSVLHFDNQHVDQIVGLDISPNGRSMASCSGDNTVRIFDLRHKRNAEILTAHDKLVSCVKFSADSLLTAGYDCVARIWRTSDYKIVKNLPIQETRIMGADLSDDGKVVATACYDRTFKLWTRRDPLKMELVV